MGQAVSCGGSARVRALDYFWRAACIIIHNDCPTLSRQCFRSEPPLSLTSELSPWPPLPSPWCGALLQGPVWNPGRGWGMGDGGLASDRLELLLVHCLCKCQRWLPLPDSSCFHFELRLCATAKLHPQPWQLLPQYELCPQAGRVGTLALLGLKHMPGRVAVQFSAHPLFREQVSIYTSLMSAVQASHSPPVHLTALQLAKGAHLPCVGPQG